MAFDPSQYTLSRYGNTGAYATGPDGVEYWYIPTDSLMGGAKIGDQWYYPTLQSGALDYIKGLQQYIVPDEWGAGLSGREISNLNTGFLLPYSDYSTKISPYATIVSASPFSADTSVGTAYSAYGFGNPNATLTADGRYYWTNGGGDNVDQWYYDPSNLSWDANKTVTTTSGGGGLFGGGFLGDIFGGIGEALMDFGPALSIAGALTGNPILLGMNAGSNLAQGNILGAVAPFVPGILGELGPSSGDVMDAAVAQGAANAGTGALGSVAQIFPIDMSTPQLLGDTATGAGGNMSWVDDLLNYTGDNAPLNTAVNTWDSLAQTPSSSASINDLLGLTQGQGFSPAAGLGYTPASAITDALGATTGLEAALTGGAGAVAAANAPSWLSNLINQAAKDPLGTASNTLKAMGLLNASGAGTTGGFNLGSLFGTGATALGSYLQGQAAQEAAQTAANAQIEAAKIAAEAAKFKPVGVTTRFGSSNFGYDDKGNLISAGYTLTPEMKAQQDALMATSVGLLNQFQGAQAATAPMGTAAQRAMQLGQGYLATDPAAQAAKYMAEQQALLATGRERDLAGLQNKLLQQGRLGLATGGTSTGMMAANPEMEAYYNAIRQQDLGLAAQATQGGMDYAKFGTGMVGTGGDLLKGMYGAQTAAFNPYQTALGGAQTIEGLGQQALDTGINIGAKGSMMAGNAGQLLATGMTNAANTQQQAAYSPWGDLLKVGGTALNQNFGTPQAGGMLNYDPNKYRLTPI